MRILYYSSLQTSPVTDGRGKGWRFRGKKSPWAAARGQESCKEDQAMDMTCPLNEGAFLDLPDFPWLAPSFASPPRCFRRSAQLRGTQLAGLP